MKSIFFGVFTLNLVVLPAAFAANPWEPGGTLETCLEAVLKERPGIVTGWQESGGGDIRGSKGPRIGAGDFHGTGQGDIDGVVGRRERQAQLQLPDVPSQQP